MKNLFSLLSILLLFFTGCKGENPQASSPSVISPPKEGMITVEVVHGEFQDIPYFIDAVGSLEAREEVDISSEVEGIIKRFFVDEGSVVKHGDLLVEIDAEDYLLRVKELEAKLKEAKVNLENAITNFNRMAQLFKKGVTPQQQYDDAQLKVKVFQVAGDNAQAALDRAKKSLRDTRILAPIKGIISKKLASKGEYVNKMNNNILLRLVDIDPLKLVFTLPERYAAQVHLGQRVEVRIEAYFKDKFYGEVYFINPQANSQTRSIEVKAWVNNPTGKLKPGFFAQVKIVQKQHQQALTIPDEAFYYEAGKAFVYLVRDGRVHRKEVQLGIRLEGRIEILYGVNDEDLVVALASKAISDGARVKIKQRD